MMMMAVSLKSGVRLACGWVLAQLCLAGASAAFIPVDLDSNGTPDRVSVQRNTSCVLTGWRSESGSTQCLRTSGPVVRAVSHALDGAPDTELAAMDDAGRLTPWASRHSRPTPQIDGAWPGRAALIETVAHLSQPTVGLFIEDTRCAEKQFVWGDCLRPARAPSPVRWRDPGPRPCFVRPLATLAICPRPPPALA